MVTELYEIQQDLPFKIEEVRALEASQHEVRMQKLCKQIRLALHLIDDVMEKMKKIPIHPEF